MNHVRKLTEGDWQSSSHELEENIENEEEMDIEVKLRKPGRYYKDQVIMMALNRN